jgi:hypothetical protein
MATAPSAANANVTPAPDSVFKNASVEGLAMAGR